MKTSHYHITTTPHYYRKTFCSYSYILVVHFTAGVLNLVSPVYPLPASQHIITPHFLLISAVEKKQSNFSIIKFTRRISEFYSQGVNLPPVENPCFAASTIGGLQKLGLVGMVSYHYYMFLILKCF